MKTLAALGLLYGWTAMAVFAQVGVSGGGTNGATSSGGASFWNGTVAPSTIVGGNGDFYLNTNTYCLYGPKAAGVWPATCVSLIGQPGAAGPALGYTAENAANKGAASGYAPLNLSAQVPLTNLPVIPYAQLTGVEQHSVLLDGFAGLIGSGIVAVSGGSASSGTLSGDVTTSGLTATVNSVGGSAAANLHNAELRANAATSNNTNSTIVMRDSSGNINAGQVFANGTAVENTTNKAKANGYAPLDGGGLLPAANLPTSAVTATMLNNGTLPGSFASVSASGPISTSAVEAGAFMMTAGASQTPPANTVGLQAPVSVPNSFNCTWWGVPAAGLVHATSTTPCILSPSLIVRSDLDPSLPAVDFSGSYTDLLNLPTIPPAIAGAPTTWPNFALVATLGTYASLTGQPIIPAASSTTPTMAGTATAGVSAVFSRGDHVHPTDTTRAPLASPSFTGTPTTPTQTAGDNSPAIATDAFVAAATTSLPNRPTTSSLDTQLFGLRYNVASTLANIAFVGHSWIQSAAITQPLTANLQASFGGSLATTCGTSGCVGNPGDGGVGFVDVATTVNTAAQGATVTSTGTWTDVNGTGAPAGTVLGPDLTASYTSSTGTKAIVCTNVTTFVIYYPIQPGAGSFQWNVDGGAWNTVSEAGSTGLGAATATTSGIGPHTLNLAWVSGTVTLFGVDCQNPTGVRVHRLGRSGSQVSDWLNANQAVLQASIASLAPNTIVNMFEVNEMNAGVVPSVYGANIATLIANWVSVLPNADEAILSASQAGYTGVPYPLSSYVAQDHTIAAAHGYGYIPNYEVMGSYVGTPPNGDSRYLTTLHPSGAAGAGGTIIAGTVQQYLLRDVPSASLNTVLNYNPSLQNYTPIPPLVLNSGGGFSGVGPGLTAPDLSTTLSTWLVYAKGPSTSGHYGITASDVKLGAAQGNNAWSTLWSNTGTSLFTFQFASSNHYFLSNSGDLHVGTAAANSLYLRGNSVDKVKITGTGTGSGPSTLVGVPWACTHGTNAACGIVTLVSGTAAINTTAIGTLDTPVLNSGYVIVLSGQTCNSCGHLSVGTVVSGTSFVINSTSLTDTSNVYWEIKYVN